MDEATSALDSEVEAAIQESLETLMQGKTVIAIAHRLSTIARMDRLVVLEKGQIAETGSHAELLAHGASIPNNSDSFLYPAGLATQSCCTPIRPQEGPDLRQQGCITDPLIR
eukprot:gene23779-28402_t